MRKAGAIVLTWSDLTKLEPELLDLENSIRNGGPHTTMKWLREYKPRLQSLVGLGRRDGLEALQTSQAYAVAYEYLDKVPGKRKRRRRH